MFEIKGELNFDKLFGLHGKAAIVTGAGSGLGKAAAELFYAAGARVALADRNAASISISGKLANAVAIPTDVSKEDDVVRLFATAADAFGAVDIVINAAGIYPNYRFSDMSVEQFEGVQAVNLRGVFLCMREAVKRMRSSGKGGSIVNVSSVASY